MILKSNAPTYEWEGAAKVGVANQDYVQTAAMLSGALVEDQVAFRLSADSQQKESTLDLNTYEPAGNSKEIRSNALRAKFLFEPKGIEGLSSTLTIAHYDSRSPQGENLPGDPKTGSRYTADRPMFETESDTGIWDIEYQANDNVTWNLNAFYTNFDIDRLALRQAARIDGEEFQIEPSIRYRSDDQKLRALAGLRYFSNEQAEDVKGTGRYRDETKTASAYLELFYALSNSLDVTFTGRYEREDRYRKGGDLVPGRRGDLDFRVSLDETYSDFMPKLVLAWKADASNNYGFSVAKGFRAGGAGVDFISGTNYKFDEEQVWNYEIFTRHRLNGGSLELNSNFFYNNYDDLQLPDGQGIINVGKSVTYGVEGGLNWLATDDVQIFANVGLLKSDISDSPQEKYNGNELPMAPTLTAATGLRYWYEDLEFGANIRYTGEYYSYFDNEPAGKAGNYATTNLQASYLFEVGRVTLFANNVFDADAEVFFDKNKFKTTDVTAPIKLQPRMVGVSVEMNF
ncbi:TonB-dependent receptor [Vibrio sonorensis]|uniref:TonB-dependent receptor n=1 Tax=Vibrio sonorensis TaxID=1004316 RepID=UPI001113C122|nr:TonB-dependent receptor [Vibrio sonorensis]